MLASKMAKSPDYLYENEIEADFSVSRFFAVNTRISGQHPMKSIIFQQVANMSFQEGGRPEGDIRDFVPRLT